MRTVERVPTLMALVYPAAMAVTALRFDLRAPAFSPASTRDLCAAALDMAGWADENDFDSVVTSEHHADEDGFMPSPVTMMAGFAARTQRIPIVASALLLPLYDPVKLSEDLCLLDLISGGRCRTTVGIGYRQDEYAMFGQDWAQRGKRMDECLEVLCKAWTGEPCDWNGRRVHMTTRPVTGPKPPIYVGGTLKVGARRAARFGLPFQSSVSKPEVLEEYLSECERLGVEEPQVMSPGSGETIFCSDDPDRSWAQIGKYLLHDAMVYASWQIPGQESVVYSRASTVEELRAGGKFRILTPEELIARAAERGPLADTHMHPLCGGTPPEFGWESLELYASKVLPHVERPAAP